MTVTKISIKDDDSLRELIDAEYEQASDLKMCRYAVALGRRVLELLNFPEEQRKVISRNLKVNEAWQKGEASLHELREASFRMHQLAKENSLGLYKAALRAIGHAIASGHVKEHAIVASDYAIKVINILFPGDMEAVRKERRWQLEQLKKTQ